MLAMVARLRAYDTPSLAGRLDVNLVSVNETETGSQTFSEFTRKRLDSRIPECPSSRPSKAPVPHSVGSGRP